MADRYDLFRRNYEEEFYCTVGYVVDNKTGWTDDFCPASYVDKYVSKLNEQEREIEHLKSVITLLEYQLRVQDRIIEEYEENM